MRKGPPSFKVFQPNSAEVIGWRALAEQAQSVAMGKTRGWVALKDMAVKARKLMVFGPLGRGNVCVCLIETAIETAESTEPHRHYPELERLACEVLKRCNAWAVVRMAELRP